MYGMPSALCSQPDGHKGVTNFGTQAAEVWSGIVVYGSQLQERHNGDNPPSLFVDDHELILYNNVLITLIALQRVR
jgi:hypothetical protein